MSIEIKQMQGERGRGGLSLCVSVVEREFDESNDMHGRLALRDSRVLGPELLGHPWNKAM